MFDKVVKTLLLSGVGLLAAPALAQHTQHSQAADTTGIAARTATMPMNDAVLAAAPDHIALEFPDRVRLVKLVLRNDQRDWVDISFRYNPRLAANYEWNLPILDEAQYYTVDWAALSMADRLVRGTFSFAIGAGKEPPSVIMEAEELLLQLRYGDPSIRYVAPPRTEIIIDQDPPQYDPPFTIDLEEEPPDN